MPLRQVAPGLWTHDTDFRPGGFALGARTTIVRLSTGGLALVSPLTMDDALVAEIGALGRVTTLVAPNKMHYKFLPAAKARFPDARVLAAPGLRAKRPQLPIDAELSDGGHELDPAIDQHLVGGMPALDEIVLLHRPSRSLIVTDLFFFRRECSHWLTRLYLKWGQALGRPAQTKLLKFFVKDRAALARTRETLVGWDFDQVVLAHGEIIESSGPEAVREALAWV
jgi:hypothetical protein